MPFTGEIALETMPSKRVQPRPKILFVTSHWPLAPAYGAQQRVLNLGRLLGRFGDVSFVIVPSEFEDEETVHRTRSEFEVSCVMRPVPVVPGGLLSRVKDRFRHEFDPTCLATDPFATSVSDRLEMEKLIQQHDVVWVHTIRTANWFRLFRWPHSVLDVDDLHSRSYQSAAQLPGVRLRRILDLRMAAIWRRRELALLERFDVLTVCSEEDRQYLSSPERIHVVPNGAHPLARCSRAISDPPRIGLLGNCTFTPNEEGAKWFIREVWPTIKREFPRAQLRLVGRGSDGYLTTLGPDIQGMGWLEDPGQEIASWSAMIVPIKVGSGTRVKMAEGFARRCPVVATTIGAFGYDVENEREILKADHADDFAKACIRLMGSPELQEALSERAAVRFLEQWTWDSFESRVGTVVRECMAISRHAQSELVTVAS